MREAVEAGRLGLWDLRPEQETVHYSPQWKRQLGFPEPNGPDSTHFWRCRVHPADLEAMLGAIRAHVRDGQSPYEAKFRLRSNGSGYRLLHSRGRVIERGADGRALRMVGVMLDLTGRPFTPREGLPQGPRGPMAGVPVALPFHQLLASDAPAEEAQRVLGLVQDLLQAALDELDELGARPLPVR